MDFEKMLGSLRTQLEKGFSPETAAPGFVGSGPSTGQCAAVSTLLNQILGVEMVSAIVNGQSHWFNRTRIGEKEYDFDLTGDQFGFPAIRLAEAGRLHPTTKARTFSDLNTETIQRARLLAVRCNLTEVARVLTAIPVSNKQV
jgi:hypothetical protein